MHSIPNEPKSYQPQELWSGRTWRTLGLIAVLGLFSCWVLNTIWFHQTLNSVGDAWHCLTTDCDPSGSAVSWKQQFEVADAEARKVDEEALLILVEARPTTDKIRVWRPDSVLEVKLKYVLTSGRYFDVRLLDSDPAATVKTSGNNGNPNPTEYAEAKARQNEDGFDYASIVVSPRQAIERVWKAKREKWGSGDYGLYDVLLSTARNGWLVHLDAINMDSESMDLAIENYTTFYFVDPHTGEIVVRDRDGEEINTTMP